MPSVFIGWTDAQDPILWPTDMKSWLIGKDLNDGKDCRQKEKGVTEDEMVGWHHWLNRHECELTLGDSEGQGNLACCNPWRRKELGRTEQRNNNKSPGRQMAPSIKSITHVGLIHSNQEWKKTPSESVFLGTDSDEAYTRDLKLGGD